MYIEAGRSEIALNNYLPNKEMVVQGTFHFANVRFDARMGAPSCRFVALMTS